MTKRKPDLRGDSGQAVIMIVGGLMGLLIAALVIAAVTSALGSKASAQRAADLAALAGGRAMLDATDARFQPATIDGKPNPDSLNLAGYLGKARKAAERTVAANGGGKVTVTFPGKKDDVAPVRIRVRVSRDVTVEADGKTASTDVEGDATARIAPMVQDFGPAANGSEYKGKLAYRMGKPMRPDVAQSFDRMRKAAAAAGVTLTINSAYRSDAEQAVLFRKNPNPKMVARPGTSLHRNATELDLGSTNYGWLQANGRRFGFIQRYSWEEWHYGYILNPGSNAAFDKNDGGKARGGGKARRGGGGKARRDEKARDGGKPRKNGKARDGGKARENGKDRDGGKARDDGDDRKEKGRGAGDGRQTGGVPAYVPAQYRPILARASQRYNVSATLLAAQISAESNWNPNAVSDAGAVGLSQFMPDTAKAFGLTNPRDPKQAIDAQARYMRDMLRQFGSVPLALAGYNAGPGRVAACMCIPPIAETQDYVAKILGRMNGAGEIAGGLVVRLVR